MPTHLYLSPHLDDAMYSCGGLIHRQVALGESVIVLTVCAGDPPDGPLSPFAQELHRRWGVRKAPIAARRREDRQVCQSMGCAWLHLEVPDAIYRYGPNGEAYYASETAIFGTLHPSETDLLHQIAQAITSYGSPEDQLYAPMGYGGHVDHRLVRLAAERSGHGFHYYPDFPYAARGMKLPLELGPPPGKFDILTLTASEQDAWATAILGYRSQFSTFWGHQDEMRQELHRYLQEHGGLPLILPPRLA